MKSSHPDQDSFSRSVSYDSPCPVHPVQLYELGLLLVLLLLLTRIP